MCLLKSSVETVSSGYTQREPFYSVLEHVFIEGNVWIGGFMRKYVCIHARRTLFVLPVVAKGVMFREPDSWTVASVGCVLSDITVI